MLCSKLDYQKVLNRDTFPIRLNLDGGRAKSEDVLAMVGCVSDQIEQDADPCVEV